ncbi:MAG: hypothetical protein COB81_07345 [Flavobacteriaceae bacterium]|nr:MAG: hypothetical protein COB81_07345 [Flavobacteriaceae bacterium]
MPKNILLCIVLLCSILSCTYFDTKPIKNTSTEKVIDTIIDLKQVDSYPMYGECSGLESKDAQWECSQKILMNYIRDCMEGFQYVSSQNMNDTIIIQLHVSKKGKVYLLPLASKNSKKLGQIKRMLLQCADSIPLIQPAIKRAIPVSSTFTLPIIIKN